MCYVMLTNLAKYCVLLGSQLTAFKESFVCMLPFQAMMTQINIIDIIIIVNSLSLPYLDKNHFEQFLTDRFTAFKFGVEKSSANDL